MDAKNGVNGVQGPQNLELEFSVQIPTFLIYYPLLEQLAFTLVLVMGRPSATYTTTFVVQKIISMGQF
jgi:hypothetical protein